MKQNRILIKGISNNYIYSDRMHELVYARDLLSWLPLRYRTTVLPVIRRALSESTKIEPTHVILPSSRATKLALFVPPSQKRR